MVQTIPPSYNKQAKSLHPEEPGWLFPHPGQASGRLLGSPCLFLCTHSPWEAEGGKLGKPNPLGGPWSPQGCQEVGSCWWDRAGGGYGSAGHSHTWWTVPLWMVGHHRGISGRCVLQVGFTENWGMGAEWWGHFGEYDLAKPTSHRLLLLLIFP